MKSFFVWKPFTVKKPFVMKGSYSSENVFATYVFLKGSLSEEAKKCQNQTDDHPGQDQH